MNNVNLARDLKENRFLSMRWERRETTNEIIGFDGTTRHHYSFASRKKLNQDWQTLQVLKNKTDNVLLPVGTTVICCGLVDVIEKHVEPGTENYLQGYRYELKECGTQSPGMVMEYNPDNVQKYNAKHS